MNRFLSIVAASIISVVSYAQDAKGTFYGEKFEEKTPVEVSKLVKGIKDTKGTTVQIHDVQVKGTIEEVCQSAGCWVRLKNPDGASVFVKFKNHFTIPMDLAGSNVIVHGVAIRKTVSVENQKHFAEDAGKSKEEIAKITEPKEELRIDASGIWIQK
jgi:hypothetical protein